MSEKKQFSFVIFGATGSTGKYLLEYVAKISNELKEMKWAIAGRSASKLRMALKSVSKMSGKDLSNIPMIEADVRSQKSLEEMAAKTKLLLNCVGPYDFLGEPVVKACIKEKTHHIDISGERKFLEGTQLKYHEEAKKANVFILGAAGIDSITCETGIKFLQEHFKGDLNSVESFLHLKIEPKGFVGHFGTFLSSIHKVSTYGEIARTRKQLFVKPVPESPHKLKLRGVLFKDKDVKHWCIPLPNVDQSIVERANYHNYHNHNLRPFQFTSYLIRPSLLQAIRAIFTTLFCGALAFFSLGRKLLEAYPKFFSGGKFSKEGPTREQVDGATFDMYFVGKGHSNKLLAVTDTHSKPPDQKIVVKVSGPEASCRATPLFMMHVALTVLEERSSMPKQAGVYTPGVALSKTTLLPRLMKHGIKYEVLSNTL